MAYKNGLGMPADIVLELGPGNSLGIGLCALLSGADKYYALDIANYLDREVNLRVFGELVELYRDNNKIPNEEELSGILPALDSYDFPRHILSKDLLSRTLKDDRINSIRNQLLNLGQPRTGSPEIIYYAPWFGRNDLKIEPVDLIYSQAVMQEVGDLDSTYKALSGMLKQKGLMSHTIDFRCYGTAKEWNGHWAYPDLVWKIIKGRGRACINRAPHSTHIALMQKYGFDIICDIKVKKESVVTRNQLAGKFKGIPEEDLTTSVAFIQAVKKV